MLNIFFICSGGVESPHAHCSDLRMFISAGRSAGRFSDDYFAAEAGGTVPDYEVVFSGDVDAVAIADRLVAREKGQRADV